MNMPKPVKEYGDWVDRKAAFEQPSPEGWMPKKGDRVWVPAWARPFAYHFRFGFVHTVRGNWLLIEAEDLQERPPHGYWRVRHTVALTVWDVRPYTESPKETAPTEGTVGAEARPR
jgi:hypothetical protein